MSIHHLLVITHEHYLTYTTVRVNIYTYVLILLCFLCIWEHHKNYWWNVSRHAEEYECFCKLRCELYCILGHPICEYNTMKPFSGMHTNKQYVKLSPLQYNIHMYYSIPSLLLSVGASFLLSPSFGGGIAETQWIMTSANYA